jgi:hypothetical protein
MGKRGPPARVVPDWIWEYVEFPIEHLLFMGAQRPQVKVAPCTSRRPADSDSLPR